MIQQLRSLHPITCFLVVASCAVLSFVGLSETVGQDTVGATHSDLPQPKAVRNLAGDQPAPPRGEARPPVAKRPRHAKAQVDPLEHASYVAERRWRQERARLSHHAPIVARPGRRPSPQVPAPRTPPAGAAPGGTTTPAPSGAGQQPPTTQTTAGAPPPSSDPKPKPAPAPKPVPKTTPSTPSAPPTATNGGTSAAPQT